MLADWHKGIFLIFLDVLSMLPVFFIPHNLQVVFFSLFLTQFSLFLRVVIEVQQMNKIYLNTDWGSNPDVWIASFVPQEKTESGISENEEALHGHPTAHVSHSTPHEHRSKFHPVLPYIFSFTTHIHVCMSVCVCVLTRVHPQTSTCVSVCVCTCMHSRIQSHHKHAAGIN